MGYNFNNYSNEYQLHGNLTSELINLYGFVTKYIKTTKVNSDRIFNEIQNLRADNSSVYDLAVYPENTGGFDSQNDILSKFGIMSFDSINLFVSFSAISVIHTDGQIQRAVGDLIVLPSKKIMEITEVEAQVPGMNNMFVYDNQKNVYILKCKPYNNNRDEIIISDTSLNIPNFDALFDIADKEADALEQNTQSKVVKHLDPVFGDM